MLSFLGFLKRPTYFFLALCMVLLSYTTARSQDCGEINQMEYGVNHWVGHAYQLNSTVRPTNYNNFFDHVYKGKLTADMLSPDDMTIDITFDDLFQFPNDNAYFRTTCDSVQQKYFGITFRSQYTVPHPGVYEIKVNQDDGATLRLNGTLVHNMWANFNHTEDTERRHYFTYNGGEKLDLILNYFELHTTNRISFSISRYYGAGVISRTQPEICTVDPNPDPFQSLGDAAFVSEKKVHYQWQFSRDRDAPESEWTDIYGATGKTYDIPRHSDNTNYAFTGKMYFRRAAYTLDDAGQVYDARIYTKPIDITLSLAGNVDQSQFGNMQWYGYVYDNYNNFNPGDFIGRLIYPKDVVEYKANFEEYFKGGSGQFTGASSSNVPGATFSGCSFEKETFSVRYKMQMPVTPGTYNFRVRGDDGFRLKISDGTNYLVPVNGEWAIDKWTNGNKPFEELTDEIVITENTTLFFTLEFTENIGDNIIEFESFKDVFGILPVEWGQISGSPCGEYNCLNWETIQEKNTSHFEVERSQDGIQWIGLGQTIPAAGYSTESIHYDLKDNGFTTKTTYYRIKQFDLDESISYSDVIRIDNQQYGRLVPYPYPNPTKDRIRFYSKEAVLRTELISHDLKILINPTITKVGEYLYEIDLENLNNVHYMLTIIKESGEREVHKIMKK